MFFTATAAILIYHMPDLTKIISFLYVHQQKE